MAQERAILLPRATQSDSAAIRDTAVSHRIFTLPPVVKYSSCWLFMYWVFGTYLDIFILGIK